MVQMKGTMTLKKGNMALIKGNMVLTKGNMVLRHVRKSKMKHWYLVWNCFGINFMNFSYNRIVKKYTFT